MKRSQVKKVRTFDDVEQQSPTILIEFSHAQQFQQATNTTNNNLNIRSPHDPIHPSPHRDT